MLRTARASVGGMWYHALNRGNRREAVFHKPGDYDAFVKAIADACTHRPIDVLGYHLMPNHLVRLLPILTTPRAWRAGRAKLCVAQGNQQGLRPLLADDEPASSSWSQAIEQILPEWAPEF